MSIGQGCLQYSVIGHANASVLHFCLLVCNAPHQRFLGLWMHIKLHGNISHTLLMKAMADCQISQAQLPQLPELLQCGDRQQNMPFPH